MGEPATAGTGVTLDAAAKLGEHRSMRRIGLVVAMSLALAACATNRGAGLAPVAIPDPRPVAGLDWILDAEEDSAELVYGAPMSDDYRLGVECRGGGDPKLGLTRYAPRGTKAEIVLSAGGVTQSYAALSEPEPMSGGVMLTSRLAEKSDPVIRAFRETGFLAVIDGDRATVLAPQPGTTAVADFFTWCG